MTRSFGQEDPIVISASKCDRAPLALLVREDAGELTCASRAIVTLPQPDRDTSFWQTTERIRSVEPPIAMDLRKETVWVRPEMRARVRALRGEEMLRTMVTEINRLPRAKLKLPASWGHETRRLPVL